MLQIWLGVAMSQHKHVMPNPGRGSYSVDPILSRNWLNPKEPRRKSQPVLGVTVTVTIILTLTVTLVLLLALAPTLTLSLA